MADLVAEKAAGVKTWQVFSGSTSSALGTHGLGWPSTGKVINFETAAEASICGSMIDAIP
jgi:hypothetical protein